MASVKDSRASGKKHVEQNTPCQKPSVLTTASGIPTGDKLNILTAGQLGPLLVEDAVFIEEMAHFNRERIPERVVHAKGAGAFGYFQVTHDITKYCKAKLFQQIGKKTPIAVRFSTASGEAGSADTARDPRGFAVKFYTEEGNWDLAGNNAPVFFIRDPILFPSLSHAQKRNPQTHLKDPNALWDFFSLCPQTMFELTHVFSDHGTPDGYRHIDGFGVHTFKLVNDKDEAVYCKFHYKTNQGIKNFSAEEAAKLAASDPDYAIRDLFEAIEKGNFPSWSLSIQVMTFKEAEEYKCNPFDATKIWSEKDFPLMPVGQLILNRNPVNYFAEVEQLAFGPSNMPPGIEPSSDKLLQGRLFSYPDAQRYRIGPNWQQLPINWPLTAKVANYQRDGPMSLFDNQGNAPNYYPNSYSGPVSDPKALEHKYKVSGDVTRYNSADDDNFSQVQEYYMHELKDDERQRLCQNIANSLQHAEPFIQERALKNFKAVHSDYEARIRALLPLFNGQKRTQKT